jgi:hypothetical protein
MKSYHQEAVDRAYRAGCTHLNKSEFMACLNTIRKQTMKANAIKSAFRHTGIHPFKPDLVIDRIKKDLTPSSGALPPYRPAEQPLPRFWNRMSIMERCAWKEDNRALLSEESRTGWAPWDRPPEEEAEYDSDLEQLEEEDEDYELDDEDQSTADPARSKNHTLTSRKPQVIHMSFPIVLAPRRSSPDPPPSSDPIEPTNYE